MIDERESGSMKAIVLMDSKRGIAKDGKQIIFIPEDLKRFKKITDGHPVIMGRKTYESLPGKKPLPGRRNIILSRTMRKCPEGFELCRRADRLKSLNDAFVIGGESVYKELIDYCDEVYVTHVIGDFGADQFFPAISIMDDDWTLMYMEYGRNLLHHEKGVFYRYGYQKYRRRIHK